MTRILTTLILFLALAAPLALTGCFHHGRHGGCGQPCSMKSEQCAKCAQDCKMQCPNCPCKSPAAPETAAPAK
jgi:hypothetical protein